MNRIITISLLSLALIGCASGPRKVALTSLVGKSLDDVSATYGRAAYGGRDSLRRDTWTFDIDDTTTVSTARPVTLAGTVGDQPGMLTGMTNGSPVTLRASCGLRVTVDESKTVVASSHTSDAACQRYFR